MKITRIDTVTIPNRHKTVRTILRQYHCDTGTVLVTILDVLSIPNNTKFVRHCLDLVNFVLYCTDEHTSLLDYGAQIKKFRLECSKHCYQKEIRRLSINRRIPQGGGWRGNRCIRGYDLIFKNLDRPDNGKHSSLLPT